MSVYCQCNSEKYSIEFKTASENFEIDVDINEIRFYERHSPLKQKTKISRLKKEIENEIE